MFCGNSKGTFLPSMVVYKAKNHHAKVEADGPMGTLYGVSKNGWFEKDTFHCCFFEVSNNTFLKEENNRYSYVKN